MTEKEYAPAPEKGSVEVMIEDSSNAKERGEIKALELEKSAKKLKKGFSINGLDVEILDSGSKGNVFFCTIKVTKDGVNIPMNNPFNFFNPPIKIWNGTYRDEGGKDIRNYEENIDEVIKSILSDAIIPQAEFYFNSLKLAEENADIPA